MNLKVFLFPVFAVLSLFLICVCIVAIPKTEYLNRNFEISERYLKNQGIYPEKMGIKLENYTDFHILSSAALYENNDLISSVLLSKTADPKKFFKDSKKETFNYFRYWFGQSFIIRLLHYITSIQTIYIFQGCLICLLFLLFLTRKENFLLALSFLAMLYFAGFAIFFNNLTYCAVYIVGLLALIACCFDKNKTQRSIIFFLTGMLTSFFDLLTAPLVSLFFSLIYVAFCDVCFAQNFDIKKWGRIFIFYPFLWVGGYIFCWASKLLFLYTLTSLTWQEIYNSFFEAIKFRSLNISSFHNVVIQSRWIPLKRNILYFYYHFDIELTMLCAVLLLFLLYNIYCLFKKEKSFCLYRFFSYFYLACIPLLEILVMYNHAFIHPHMEYRNITISFACIIMMFTAFQKKKCKKLNQ